MAKRASLSVLAATVLGFLVLCGPAWADPNLVSHWKLDETCGTTAHDSAGTNDGTVYGASWTSGQINGAISFDGSNDYVDVGAVNALNPGENDVTYAVWFKTSYTGIRQTIVNFIGGDGWTGDGEYQLLIEDNGNLLGGASRALPGHGYLHAVKVGSFVADGEWHFGAFVFDYSERVTELFLDGMSEGMSDPVDDFAAPLDQINRKASIGVVHAHDGDKWWFNGRIDDVQIYDRALAAEEVQQLYYKAKLESAIVRVEDAVTEKEAMLEKIDELLEKEEDAYETLEQLLENKIYIYLTKADIVKAKQKIHSAIQHEVQSADAIDKSTEKLSDALSALGWEPPPLPPPQPEPDPNLVSHWKLDETCGTTAHDSAGDNDGTVYGASWTSGQIGGALDFDGVSNYVNCGNGANLDNMAAISVSAWICPKGWGGTSYYPFGVGRILSKRFHPNNAYELCMAENIKSVGAGFYGDNGAVGVFASENSIILNEWTHVTATNTGTEQKIYINGTESGSNNINTGDIRNVSANLYIGHVTSAYVDVAFDGKIDDVRIYDRALSAGDVQQLYQSGL